MHISKEFHDVKNIENLIDDKDFLQIYFKEPGLDFVYFGVNIEQGFRFYIKRIKRLYNRNDCIT